MRCCDWVASQSPATVTPEMNRRQRKNVPAQTNGSQMTSTAEQTERQLKDIPFYYLPIYCMMNMLLGHKSQQR